MNKVFRAVFLYLVASLLLAALLYDDFPRLLRAALGTTIHSLNLMIGAGYYVAPVLVAVLLAFGWRRMAARTAPLIFVTLASVLLPIGFSFMKNAIPEIVPYYADPALASFDRWLHLGLDPWRALHQWFDSPAMGQVVDAVYLNLWALPAFAFPIVVVATETDEARMTRYVWLFFISWFVVGNLLALAGSSVGPVYYDRLIGGERFAALAGALGAGGMGESAMGAIQERLWARYEGGGVDLGLGISAFPSMHVAVAFITALYLSERAKWIAPLGFAFFGAILVLSVYSGYHYAIDGYASVAVVLALNAVLKRQARRAEGAIILRSAAASQLLHSAR